jgi:hypothetical protein
MLEVCEIQPYRFRKYVLRNKWTGIVIDRRFWTIRGALRVANRSTRKLNNTINNLNTGRV